MSVSSLHWRENRVREEIYKQDLKQIDTSAHETGLPKSKGATIASGEQNPEARQAENKKKNRRLRWIILSLAILAAGGATWFWIYLSQFESTDDAYITGHEHPVSFRVSGTISEVLVDDTQLLKKGDPIARLDPRDFEVALVQARAQHLQAKAQLQQASVQIPLVEAQLAQARAQADSAKANSDYLERTFQRNSELFSQGRGVISKQDLDTAQSQAATTLASYQASLAAVYVSRENLKLAQAQQQAAAAQLDAALASVQNAELQLSYTTVYASTDGWVAQKTFEVGQHVQAGQAGLSIAERSEERRVGEECRSR